MRTLTILAAFLLTGCATTGEAPDWVQGTAAAYPATDFLLGRGSGDAVAPAQERARADLAKGISVAVNAASEDVQRAESGAGAGAYSGQHEQRISTRSEALLRGVRQFMHQQAIAVRQIGIAGVACDVHVATHGIGLRPHGDGRRSHGFPGVQPRACQH